MSTVTAPLGDLLRMIIQISGRQLPVSQTRDLPVSSLETLSPYDGTGHFLKSVQAQDYMEIPGDFQQVQRIFDNKQPDTTDLRIDLGSLCLTTHMYGINVYLIGQGYIRNTPSIDFFVALQRHSSNSWTLYTENFSKSAIPERIKVLMRGEEKELSLLQLFPRLGSVCWRDPVEFKDEQKGDPSLMDF